MTKKRFKKLLMGEYGYQRNRAEKLSQEQPRSIEKKNSGTVINGHVFVLDKNKRLHYIQRSGC